MARQFLLLFACIFALNVSLVLSREDYYQHFSNIFSHHHRRSTPDADVVSTEIPVTVTGGMPHADASRSTINYAKKTTGERVEVIQKGYTSYNSSYSRVNVPLIIGIVVGSIVILLLLTCCMICCCCPGCFRTVTPGYVLTNNAAPIASQPQQLAPESQLLHTAVPVQQLPNYPPGYNFQPMQQQHYPPEYQQFQTLQAQQQFQYSPTHPDCHNPPTAPPPYSEKY